MDAVEFIAEPREVLKNLTVLDGKVRRAFIAQRGPDTPPRSRPDPDEVSNADLLEQCASLLESNLVLVGIAQAARELAVTTFGAAVANGRALFALADRITGLDCTRIVSSKSGVFARPPKRLHPDPSAQLSFPQDTIIRMCAAVLATCPIEDLEALATELELVAVGHRCRVAFDRLRRLAARAELDVDHGHCVVGRAFSEARLSLDEAAKILRVSPADALVLFEELHFVRPIESLALTPEQRAEAYGRLRKARLRGVEPDAARVGRVVVASQRIEDIDARNDVLQKLS